MQAALFTQTTPATRKNARGRPHARLENSIWAGAMAVLAGATIVGLNSSGVSGYLGLDIAAGCVSVALVPFLARWPVAVTVVLAGLAAVSPAATPAATMAVLLVSCWRPLPVAAEVAGTGIAAHLLRELWRPYGGLPYVWWTVVVCAGYAALVGWGTLTRANGELIASLRERAEHAEADQARRVAEAREAERARIAREMHDVLAHRLSLLATYAGAISYRPDAPPEQMSSAAEVIRTGVHQALDELREVISVLREDEPEAGAADSRPQPGIGDVPDLIGESRAAGMQVEASGAAWDQPQLPDAIGRTVYRVVQEGLTNARKHAPDEPVRIALSGAPGPGLHIDIANTLPAAPGESGMAGSGAGLIGLAERLELAGGWIEHRTEDRQFRLHAWLPWLPAAAAGSGSEESGAEESGSDRAGSERAEPETAEPETAEPGWAR